MSFVIDASVMVEILQRTPTGVAVERRVADHRMAVPDIFDSEVASVVRRRWRNGRIDEGDAAAALDALLDWPADRIPSRLLVKGTRRWWPNVSTYDALYLAVASARSSRVLTCDGPLSRAPALGVPVENVRVT
ncbi:MAG TPA: type II toxin-antitoxin system VapC family toxin [Acidimicrobiales bacterium]|nr:type II toxin-antitoxin system VapC family toxin [Acidimicrobiales bacterium]